MKNKLGSLYLLQIIDLEVDELNLLRGDLPESVKALEARIAEYESKKEELEKQVLEGMAEQNLKELESKELQEGIDRHKKQLLEVRNNKEYDALNIEIDNAEKKIEENEGIVEQITVMTGEIRASQAELDTLANQVRLELEDKYQQLKEVSATTEEDEKVLMAHRHEALKEISDEYLEMYNRIRNAKNGKAVVPIRNKSCSGCNNVIPPQLRLEIKKHNKLYICEHCGRILVSEQIANETKIK